MGRGVDDEPLLELAVSHALLREASEHDVAPVVRIYQPSVPMAVFGRRDVRAPGFARAVEGSRVAGFVPATRVTGGRAVAYTSRALVVDIVQRQADALLDHDRQFERYGRVFVDAFRHFGIDARVGAVPGEYCPGAHSVNARGTTKLVGTSQRVVRNAWLFSALVVVDEATRLRPVLTEMYAHLGPAVRSPLGRVSRRRGAGGDGRRRRGCDPRRPRPDGRPRPGNDHEGRRARPNPSAPPRA